MNATENMIGDEGARVLSEALNVNTTLASLSTDGEKQPDNAHQEHNFDSNERKQQETRSVMKEHVH